jgi:hypothetical protein
MVQQCLHITSKMDQQNGGDDGTCQLEFLARQRKKCFKKAGIQSSRLSPSSLTIADLQVRGMKTAHFDASVHRR